MTEAISVNDINLQDNFSHREIINKTQLFQEHPVALEDIGNGAYSSEIDEKSSSLNYSFTSQEIFGNAQNNSLVIQNTGNAGFSLEVVEDGIDLQNNFTKGEIFNNQLLDSSMDNIRLLPGDIDGDAVTMSVENLVSPNIMNSIVQSIAGYAPDTGVEYPGADAPGTKPGIINFVAPDMQQNA